MGKTSNASKDRYNSKAYDDIRVRVPKGKKDIIQNHAQNCGESINGFIARAIQETMERDKQGVLKTNEATESNE